MSWMATSTAETSVSRGETTVKSSISKTSSSFGSISAIPHWKWRIDSPSRRNGGSNTAKHVKSGYIYNCANETGYPITEWVLRVGKWDRVGSELLTQNRQWKTDKQTRKHEWTENRRWSSKKSFVLRVLKSKRCARGRGRDLVKNIIKIII